MSDGGDDAADILSRNMVEVRDALCAHYGDVDTTRRIQQIFLSKLKPAQIERYAYLQGADTEAGVEIQVFPPGSDYYVANDTLKFGMGIYPGHFTWVGEYNAAGNDFVWDWETKTVFSPGPPFPNRWIDYRDNKLRVYSMPNDEEDPAQADGGDDPMAAFVDLCA